MHLLTQAHINDGVPILQYYGKWPFYRFLGIQEPASVLFSLLNLQAHIYGYQTLNSEVPLLYEPVRNSLIMSSLANVNAWIWSTIFHCRDTWITEKLDYFSAMAVILFAIYSALLRLLLVNSRKYTKSVDRAIRTILIFFFCLHCIYLTFWRFDYQYNMIISLVLGIAHNLSWFIWCLRHLKDRPYAKYGLFACVAVISSISLEIFDFPPIYFVFDAHSLWHLSTVPIAYLWYYFILEDSRYQFRDMLHHQ